MNICCVKCCFQSLRNCLILAQSSRYVNVYNRKKMASLEYWALHVNLMLIALVLDMIYLNVFFHILLLRDSNITTIIVEYAHHNLTFALRIELNCFQLIFVMDCRLHIYGHHNDLTCSHTHIYIHICIYIYIFMCVYCPVYAFISWQHIAGDEGILGNMS